MTGYTLGWKFLSIIQAAGPRRALWLLEQGLHGISQSRDSPGLAIGFSWDVCISRKSIIA